MISVQKKTVMEFLPCQSSNRNPLSKGAMKLPEMGDSDDHQVEMFHSAHGFSSRPAFHARPGHAINPRDKHSFRGSCPCTAAKNHLAKHRPQ